MRNLPPLPDWSHKTLLIAEDLDDNYAVLAALLKRTNIRLFRAYTGKEAIEMVLHEKTIDIILMDISMPDIDGIEALRLIKQHIPDKIVIAQTAHELSIQLSKEKFDDYIQKPIRRQQLIDILSKYLS